MKHRTHPRGSSAIPTLYKGVEYRSRLEARWAAFFDRLGWDATYEPFDGDGYIPDFLIHGTKPLLVEVKPAATPSEYKEPVVKLERGLAGHWTHDILIVGATPLYAPFPGPFAWNPDHPIAGWLGEAMAWGDDFDGWDWAQAIWGQCSECATIGVYHEVQSFHLRPGGCYDGGSGFSDPGRSGGRPVERCEHGPVPRDIDLNAAWADAMNDVKWYGRDAVKGMVK